MEKHSVKELKAIARTRGIKGYYNLRKVELVEALATSQSPPSPPPPTPNTPLNILDEPIPEINGPPKKNKQP